jgi:hypothetical protein
MATRWEELNCICQCAEENIFAEGAKPKFAEYLMLKHGYDIIYKLNKQGQTYFKPTAEYLKELIKKYSTAVGLDKGI